jgi:hypothetical protein
VLAAARTSLSLRTLQEQTIIADPAEMLTCRYGVTMPESKGIALLKRSNLLKEKSFSDPAARR